MTSRALVLGASGGIGAAVRARLVTEGCDVQTLSRAEGLDWQNPEQAEVALEALEGPFDLIFDATGALEINGTGPEKQLAAIEANAMAAQFAVNAIGPALIFKHARRLLPRDRPSTVATISARVGSIGDNRLGGWISYRAAKAALNQIVRTAAIELARTRPMAVAVALHPGTVATGLSNRFVPASKATTPEVAAANMLEVLAVLTPEHSGAFFAYDGSRIPW